ncbi:hypothetical protein IV38_GL001940 [Lactobacillus selangorensis]|uniref:Uncharacterized protein n=1 Tax=Lactobacillus selangorensis TaxID=81857 RepID=A0A0R2FGH4_9LACO|nr:hypothetical protein [Lactobacillus selangorensis]KRN27727.1 hypothetical protein IV38_GL001940 [Lactobacillus selangorensis]KRN30308.1 hypothetical protein IV40_GL001897 [Lactobacillus selangorensis]
MKTQETLKNLFDARNCFAKGNIEFPHRFDDLIAITNRHIKEIADKQRKEVA